MTREEAIRMIERIKDRINWEVVDSQKKMDALNMAIKSLEAWSKVMKEINESFINNDLDFGEETYYNSALVDVLEIIDKHLPEVSE